MKKNEIRKRFIVGLLICVFLIAAFAGCGKTTEDANKETKAGEQTTGTKATEKEEPYEFTAFRSSWQGIDENNDLVVQELNKRLNIKIRILTAPYESWEEKYNVYMASNTVPDVSCTNGTGWGNFNSWAKQGKYLDLTDLYQKHCPNIRKYLAGDVIEKVKIGGKLYGVPKPSLDSGVLFYRKDWLDKVGLKLPETIDEFDAVVRAFTFNDPDNNGKDDTYGMLNEDTLTQTKWLFMAFGTGANLYGGYDWFMKDDGTIESSIAQPGAKDAIKYLAGLYKEGILDPEWMLTKSQGWYDKLVAGKGGIASQGITSYLTMEADMQKVDPKARLEPVPYIKGKDGVIRRTTQNGYYMMNSISSKAEKPEKILELLDYMASDEGSRLIAYGIENVTYEMKNGKPVYKEEEAKKYSVFGGHLLNRMMAQTGTGLPDDERGNAYKKLIEPYLMANISPIPPVELPSKKEVLSKQGADFVMKKLTEMVNNKIDIDANWDSFIKEWWETGGEQLTKEINEAYKAAQGK